MAKNKDNKTNNKINPEDMRIDKKIDTNITTLKRIFLNDQTIKYRSFQHKTIDKIKCCAIFAHGMANQETINENIIDPIMRSGIDHVISHSKILDIMIDKVIISNEIVKTDKLQDIVTSILYGSTILIFDGVEEALIIDSKGWEFRAIDEPNSEGIVRGPREGFTEALIVNLSLIRRRILTPDLKFMFKEIGARTKTKICICHIEGLAHEKILQEVIDRLDKIEIDGILESGYIEELIKDEPYSPFHTIGNTERPDVAAANLLEGKVVIVCDGTPFVLTLPYLFLEYFQASEDYYSNYIFSTVNRLIRYIGFFLSSSVPAIYLAFVTFHQEMIPTPLLLSISASREGVPFPTIFETLLMLFVFEVLREAGTRLPKPIGQTVSIVGALVLGEAAVTAKLISAPIVIVTALTGITSFLIPKMIGPLIIVRTLLVILSSILGLYGYIFGIMGLFIHLMSMRTFGIPYVLSPGPINKQDIKDTFIRAPWWQMYYRPKLIGDRNSIRRSDTRRSDTKKSKGRQRNE